MPHPKMSLRVYGALFLTTLFWSSAFVGIRFTLTEFSPGALGLLRFCIASFSLALFYLRLENKKPVSTQDKIALMGVGVIGIGLYNFFLNLGEVVVSASIASFIIGLLPLVTILLAISFLKEKVGRRTWCGVFIAVIGMILLGLSSSDKSSFLGECYVFIATILGAIYTTLQKQFLNRYHPLQVTSYIIWGGTLSLLVFLPSLVIELPEASLLGIGTVIYMGVFPAAVAYLAWSYVIHEIPASKAVIFLYLLPLFSSAMGFLLLEEVPKQLTIIGGILGLLGAFVASRDKTAS
jgi:drug/metabolite transporter (DMT)-like permease